MNLRDVLLNPKLPAGLSFIENSNKLAIDLNKAPEFIKSIDIPLLGTAEFHFDVEIDAAQVAKRIGVDLSPYQSFTVEYDAPVPVQIRKHKKKRINKKWAKRYGYTMVIKPHKLTDVTFKPSDDENELICEMIGGRMT